MADTKRVLIANTSSDSSVKSLELPDPVTGEKRAFLLGSSSLQEVNVHKQACSSWLIDESICSDGSLLLASPVDPLLVTLPCFERARNSTSSSEGRFCSISQVLDDDACPELQLLEQLVASCARCICDCKEAGGEYYYRLSDDRVLAWLHCKLKQVCQVLSQENGPLHGVDEASQQSYGLGFLGEYVHSKWVQQLGDLLNVQPSGKVTSSAGAEVRQRSSEDAAIKTATEKKPKLTHSEVMAAVKQQNFAKSAAGCKKISSFFGKKK